jgi:hypothetical protein
MTSRRWGVKIGKSPCHPCGHCLHLFLTSAIRGGIGSLSKRCQYCSKAEASYPLILSDDARLAVYHAACAAALATEILVDLYTFWHLACPLPPALCSHRTRSSSSSGDHAARASERGARRTTARLERSDTCNQRTSARSRRLNGIKPSSGRRGSVVPWGRWLPSEQSRGESLRYSPFPGTFAHL